MAKLPIDISGRRGLVERYQGDLNDTSAKPNLRYVGEAGQFADGIFNPIKSLGFINPANNVYADISGTINDEINSIQYDNESDKVFLSEQGRNVTKLDALSDVSLVNFLTISSGKTITDMQLYEINQKKALFFSIDTGTEDPGVTIGYRTIDETGGAALLQENALVLSTNDSALYELKPTGTNSVFANPSEGRRLAQSFDSDSLGDLYVTGINLAIARGSGTTTSASIKISIQGTQDRNTSPYTYQGTWTTSTGYLVNDTIEYNSVTYQCTSNHTSGSLSEPEVGAAWEDYWNIFAAPDGTAIAEKTVTVTDLQEARDDIYKREEFLFDSPVTLTAATQYWIVIEEVGTNLTGSDVILWKGTVDSGATFSDQYLKAENDITSPLYWKNVNFNKESEGADFQLVSNVSENLSNKISHGADILPFTGESAFLYLSDNALLYLAVGNTLSTFDGGITGGSKGRFNKEVLTFPSYINLVDIEETRSQMYIAIQSSNRKEEEDDKYFKADRIGVFVWNRRSRLFGGTDFYPAPGAKEMKKVFLSSDGTVKAITVGNSGFTEIRAASGNEYRVIHTLGKNAYPVSRRSVSQVNGMNVWMGLDGVFYAYGSISPGQPDQLYKIGAISTESGFSPGPIFVGHEEASEPRLAILQAWSDGTPTLKLQKWYPNGDGTISTVNQTAHIGNVFTKVERFPAISKVRSFQVFFAPASGGDKGTTAASIKVYFNHYETSYMTMPISQADLAKGYIDFTIGAENVFAIQFEIEWNTTETLGNYDFVPSQIVVDYEMTDRRN